jgi:hypothetical protein
MQVQILRNNVMNLSVLRKRLDVTILALAEAVKSTRLVMVGMKREFN